MSSAIKLVVTDVDGTLVVPHSHVVSRANLETIARLERAGIHVALATARPPEYARAVAGNLQFKGLHVVDGGASVYDYDKNAYVWQEWLPMNTIQAVATVLLPYAKNVIDCFPGFKMVPVTEFTIDDITESAPYTYTQITPSDWLVAVQALRTALLRVSITRSLHEIRTCGMCRYIRIKAPNNTACKNCSNC